MDVLSYLLGKNAGGGAKGLKVEVVETLPQTGESNVLYLVPKQTAETSNVFDEYLYINNAWEKIGTTDIDLSGYVTDEELLQALATKQNTMQYSTMPTASADNLGKIVQYTGATDSTYTNGHFYIVVSDGETEPTYSWEEISFGGGSSGTKYVINSRGTTEANYEVINKWLLNLKEILDTPYASVRVENDTNLYIYYTGVSEPQMYRFYYSMVGGSFSSGNFTLELYIQISTILSKAFDKYRLVVNNWETQSFTQVNSASAIGVVKYSNYAYTHNVFYKNNLVLPVTNTDQFTPTGDYNPSTKLYTDKTHYENMAGYDATKTQVLKNVQGVLQWVDEA